MPSCAFVPPARLNPGATALRTPHSVRDPRRVLTSQTSLPSSPRSEEKSLYSDARLIHPHSAWYYSSIFQLRLSADLSVSAVSFASVHRPSSFFRVSSASPRESRRLRGELFSRPSSFVLRPSSSPTG